MEPSQAQWNIERGQHHEILAVSRLDNLVVSSALFLFSFFTIYGIYAAGLIKQQLIYAFPIIMVICGCIIQFNCIVNAVFAFKFKNLGYRQLNSLAIKVFNDQPWIFLSTIFVRAVILPICLQLIWAFAMIDFNVGQPEYVLTFVMVACVIVIIAALIVGYTLGKPSIVLQE